MGARVGSSDLFLWLPEPIVATLGALSSLDLLLALWLWPSGSRSRWYRYGLAALGSAWLGRSGSARQGRLGWLGSTGLAQLGLVAWLARLGLARPDPVGLAWLGSVSLARLGLA